jgi:hypothetical protein
VYEEPIIFQDYEEAMIVDQWFIVECRSSVPMPLFDDCGCGSTADVQWIKVWECR